MLARCRRMAPGKGAGYQPLQQDGGAGTSIYSTEGGPPRSGRTPAQRKWWFAVCASLVGDLIVCIMIYVTTHYFAPPLVGSGSYTEDTFDLLLLAIGRPVVNGVLVALTLTKGMIDPGNEDALPHKMSARARAQEANSFNIRLALQSLVFLTRKTSCAATRAKKTSSRSTPPNTSAAPSSLPTGNGQSSASPLSSSWSPRPRGSCCLTFRAQFWTVSSTSRSSRTAFRRESARREYD